MRLFALLCTVFLVGAGCFAPTVELGSIPCLRDSDGDGVCDDEDQCPGPDQADADGDRICDGLDQCPGADDRFDADEDGVCDAMDRCPGDDLADADGDGICDDMDRCPGGNDADDADFDGVCDTMDVCPGEDDHLDVDGDGIANCMDLCDYDGPTPPTMYSLPNNLTGVRAILQDVAINGQRFLKVSPGAIVEVTARVDFGDCNCPNCLQQLRMGLWHDPLPTFCPINRVAGCPNQTVLFREMLEMPAVPGQYGLRMDTTQEFDCDFPQWGSGSKRIDELVVICVE